MKISCNKQPYSKRINQKNLSRVFIDGLVFGLGLLFLIELVLWASAYTYVDQGSETDPSAGPNELMIKDEFALDCQKFSVAGDEKFGEACPDDRDFFMGYQFQKVSYFKNDCVENQNEQITNSITRIYSDPDQTAIAGGDSACNTHDDSFAEPKKGPYQYTYYQAYSVCCKIAR